MANLFDEIYDLGIKAGEIGHACKFPDIRPGGFYKLLYIRPDEKLHQTYNREPYILVSSIQKETGGYTICGVDLCLLEEGALITMMRSFYDNFKKYVNENDSTKGIQGFNDDTLMALLAMVKIPKTIIRKYSLSFIKELKAIDYYEVPTIVSNMLFNSPNLSKPMDIKEWRFRSVIKKK